eukprot:CAMPEP_0203659360 /NCGR_PEP_ID=MMETSP0088-20131115/51683_1 /ASSEMBLY_ACC=CAM_ASM_001087 /TAXON_ID=426623 /ORGANISM="Chaetoceros affinis, Strain CCMP159" /LENGTH=152 /DNA_ID=CAMNT_0050521369 /DNA_START=34 /DNA_END=489 /DNA_ORIENTATION=-
MTQKVLIVHGGELANDVAQQVVARKPSDLSTSVVLRNASERPKQLMEEGRDTVICFIIQTIENGAPTEEGGTCLRFFKRKTHPEDLLKNKFSYSVLGLGDSNLLLDRQTTSAADCNQSAQELDSRLQALGGTCFHELGISDERTGLVEVEPW